MEGGNTKSAGRPDAPVKDACSAACNSIYSSSNPSIVVPVPGTDTPGLVGSRAVESRWAVEDEEECEGSRRVDAPSSASVRFRESGLAGSVWTTAKTE